MVHGKPADKMQLRTVRMDSRLHRLLNRSHGFTMIELILVSALILILINVSTPLFRRTFHTIRIENSSRDLSQLIRYLNSRSIVEGVRYRLKLDFQDGTYWAESSARSRFGNYAFKPVSGRIGGLRRVSRAISLEGKTEEISFYPDGHIDDAEIVLEDTSGLRYRLKISNSDIMIQEITEGSD